MVAGLSIYAIKPAFRGVLEPLAKKLDRVHPNAISAAAVLFASAAATLLALAPAQPFLYLAVPPLLGLRIACNALDGLVAQRTGRATKRGGIVNEVSDRASDLIVLSGLAASGVSPVTLIAWAAVATLAVSYLGVLAPALGLPRRQAGPFGKADRMAYLSAVCLVATFGHVWNWTVATVWTWAMMGYLGLATLTILHRMVRLWMDGRHD